jgi:hypothetical protein
LYNVSAGLSTPSIINLPVAAVTVNVTSSSSASATMSSEPLELPVDAASVIRPKSSLYVITPDTIATSSRTD